MQEGRYIPCCCFSSYCSTGSRYYLFRTDRNENNEIERMVEVYSDECQPGINSYVNKLDKVWKPLYRMISGSERLLHSSSSVPLFIFATAGMRVLSESNQRAIYDAIYDGYRHSNLRFYLSRDNLQTIDGELEAVYGWLTVNVLKSRITPSLKYTTEPTIGSLDLGGESTQIAYQYRSQREGESVDIQHDLFSKSFLSFGAKEAQFRFENYILSNREAFRDENDNRQNRLHVPNPCNNVGVIGDSKVYEGLYHEGTGNLDRCEAILTQLIRGDTECTDTVHSKCSLWSLKIPSMEGDFVGMSLYFFVVDFVKSIYQLGDQVHPSIDDLKTLGRSFCSMNWTVVLAQFSGKHKYTNDEVLKQRCFQLSYVITLLEHGFRFLETYESSSSQPSYNIMFLRHINGESVDWTYGAALYEGKNPIPKQVSGFLLFVVLAVLLFFVLLLIFSNRNVVVRYKKLPII